MRHFGIKIQKNFGEGAQPPPQTPPRWGGTHLPQTPPPRPPRSPTLDPSLADSQPPIPSANHVRLGGRRHHFKEMDQGDRLLD